MGTVGIDMWISTLDICIYVYISKRQKAKDNQAILKYKEK